MRRPAAASPLSNSPILWTRVAEASTRGTAHGGGAGRCYRGVRIMSNQSRVHLRLGFPCFAAHSLVAFDSTSFTLCKNMSAKFVINYSKFEPKGFWGFGDAHRFVGADLY